MAVAAVDRYVAEDALELIDIDYEPLPHVVTVEDALRPGAPQLHATVPSNVVVESTVRAGEPDAAAGRRGRDRRGHVPHQPGERRADRDARRDRALGGGHRARSSCGPPRRRRTCCAPSSRTACAWTRRTCASSPRTWAARFGLKIGVYPEDIIAALLAIDTRRPGEVDRGPHGVLPRRRPRARGRAHADARPPTATARCSRCATGT